MTARHQSRFAIETAQTVAVELLGRLSPDGDLISRLPVLGEQDRSHPTATEYADDRVGIPEGADIGDGRRYDLRVAYAHDFRNIVKRPVPDENRLAGGLKARLKKRRAD